MHATLQKTTFHFGENRHFEVALTVRTTLQFALRFLFDSLSQYAALKAKKGKLYSAYKQTRDEMIELRTAKSNADRILGATEEEKNRDRQQEVR